MQLLDINSIFIVFGKKDIYIIADRHAYNLRKLCQKINFITKIIIKKVRRSERRSKDLGYQQG